MDQVTLSVPDISCDHCKMSIEGAVNELSGIDSAVVDVAGRTVDVSFDAGAQSLESIVAAIEEQGYEVATSQ
ncbi:MAG: copper ion binding protein [Acidimicrobiia bacterium]|nr:copper ion binding protein [Acidimicrobiia bacterium]